MKKSLAEYVNGLDLTPEEKAAVDAILKSEKVRGAIDKDLAGAQSEISRQFDAAAKAKTDAEKKNADYYKEVSDWKTQKDQEFQQKEAQFRKTFETNAQYKARLEGMVAAGTIDQEDVADLLTTPVVKVEPVVKQEPTVDPNKYISREAYQSDAATQMQLAAALQDLQAEHYELYGKPMAGATAMLNKALTENRPLREVFDETYKISERRQELQAEADKNREAQIRADERMKVMSEVSNPASRPAVGVVSPVLNEFSKPAEGAAHSARGVMAAVQAFQAGKYKDAAQ